jgi:hypothetical protein
MGILAGGCASGSSIDSSVGESSSGSAITTTSANNIDRVASGAVEDSQNACMERIPKGASAGQGMLAEDSCATIRRIAANDARTAFNLNSPALFIPQGMVGSISLYGPSACWNHLV